MKIQMRYRWLLLLLLATRVEADENPSVAAKVRRIDKYTLSGDKHFVSGYSAKTQQGLINVVVEIPSGTNAKWEVDATDGRLKWEMKQGKPRVVNYLPYPGNYGMIPRTLLSKERGGDGDPLDVLILGPALPRGSVVEVKLIGVLKFLDGGEKDDKLIAVMPGSALGRVDSLDHLKSCFGGSLRIVQLWFSNYKGKGAMVFKGRGDRAQANAILDATIKAFEAAAKK